MAAKAAHERTKEKFANEVRLVKKKMEDTVNNVKKEALQERDKLEQTLR